MKPENMRWRKKNPTENKTIRELLVLWAGYPLEDAPWELEDHFIDQQQLNEDFESGFVPEEK